MMKKIARKLLIIFTVLIAVVLLTTGYVFLFHKDLVMTVYKGFTTSDEQLKEQLEQNKKQEQQAVKDAGLESVVIDKEIEQKIISGEVSTQDVANMLLGNAKDENKDVKPQDENNQVQTNTEPEKSDLNVTVEKEPENSNNTDVVQIKNEKPAEDNKENQKQNEQVAQLVAQMYVLKAQYTSQIEGIVESMKKEYSALEKNQRTTAAKTSIASKYLNTISTMEAQCDAQVNKIVSQLRQVLEDTGQDQTLADSILAAYKNEKEITKSYYISKYS